MAHEALTPHHDEIVQARADGQTLTQLADMLADTHGVQTTAASLSRYLKSVNEPNAPAVRVGSPEQERLIEISALVMETNAYVQGRSEEMQTAVAHLAGKLAGLGARIDNLTEAQAETLAEVRSGTPSAAQASDTSQQIGGAASTAPVHEFDGATLLRIWTRAALIVSALWAGGLVTLWAMGKIAFQ